MNVFVESKPNCLATLRVELPPDRVEKEWKTTAKAFQKQARIPGFRPGKAPAAIIEKRFEDDIKEEVQNRLLRTSMNEAIEQKKLRVISVTKVDNVEIGADRTMSYSATLVTAPEFDLPPYSGLELELKKVPVGEKEVEDALNTLAEQHSEFETVEGRALAMDDFAVLSYAGTLDEKPLADAVEGCPPLLAGKPNWWVRMAEGTLAPGFCEALVGMNVDEERKFDVALPEEFPFEPLRGTTINYVATLHEVRERKMPEFDDALASRIEPGKTMAELREQIQSTLERYAEQEYENGKRSGVMKKVLEGVRFDLPQDMVHDEMSGIMREIVEENQGRGVSDEELQAHEDQIQGAAEQSAQERVRSRFVLMRIAEKEKIEVTQQELAFHVTQMAQRYQIPPNKMVKDLQKRNALGTIREQILVSKSLDFVVSSATVREPAA
ncbi:MAG: trigger factor [Chthoniobacterales bacterium]